VGNGGKITKKAQMAHETDFMGITFPSWPLAWICSQHMIKGNQMDYSPLLPLPEHSRE